MYKILVQFVGLLSLFSVTSTALGAFESGDSVQAIFLKDWSMAAAKKVQAPNPVSDLVSDQNMASILRSVPTKCQAHLAKETEHLKHAEYNSHQWMTHVAQCKCCGPVLAGIFATHVNNVAHLPHVVVFFDFDSSTLTPDNQERLRQFIVNNRKPGRRFLLIGRASRTLRVNSSLDYLRDHSTYNLQLSEKRSLVARDFISTLLFNKEPVPDQLYDALPIRMFGMADPQIDPRYVGKYNIDPSQWKRRYFKGKDPSGTYRLNQSVVVIAFDGKLRKDIYAELGDQSLSYARGY